MNCPNCGADCLDTQKFCGNCGTALSQTDPAVLADEIIIPTAPEAEACPVEPILPPEASAVPSVPERKGRLWPPAVFLCVMVCLGLLVFFLSGYLPESSPTPWFWAEDGVLYFDQYLYTGSSELVIPETVDGQAVTALAEACFAECDGLTTVILPSSLKEIGSFAFAECDDLRGIYIPQGVSTVGEGAFYGCDALEAICIPGTVEEIHSETFADTPSLRYILFSGSHSDWNACFSGQLGENVEIHAEDGTFGYTPSP